MEASTKTFFYVAGHGDVHFEDKAVPISPADAKTKVAASTLKSTIVFVRDNTFQCYIGD